jgi:hypothetical protein
MTRTLLAFGLLLGATACPGDPSDPTDTAATEAASTGGTDGVSTTGVPTTDAATTATDATTTDGTATDATTTGGPEAGESCDCDPGLDDCGRVICPPVFALCMGDCADIQLSSPDDEASIACVLEALRDRTPGGISLILNQYEPLLSTIVVIKTFSDGSAWLFRREAEECMPMGFSATGPDAVVALREPAHFADCLADTDPVQRFLCARDPAEAVLTECAPRAELCE